MLIGKNVKDAIISAESQKSLILMQNKLTDYDIGLYNGIEYILSRIKDREPEYISATNEPEIKQQENEIAKRTVASGVKRRE